MSNRAERKARQRAHFAELDRIAQLSAADKAAAEERRRQEREAYERAHPVSSGVIPLVDYVPPPGTYRRR